jgi:membrane-bound serine protease (ClpP class)
MIGKRILFITWILAGMLSVFPHQTVYAQDAAPQIIVLKADGALTPSMAEYLERGLSYAETRQAEALIFQFDTPGGSTDLMERMAQDIRASLVPVVVYVAPQGAMAGSAGSVISLSAHVLAMAPNTIIGAASPVGGQGEDLPTTEAAKLKSAYSALMRTYTEQRGEQAVGIAEDMINNAKAVNAKEALDAGLIDFIALDMNDLLRQLDGRTVTIFVNGTQRTLHTQGAQVSEFNLTFIEEFLGTLTNPNVVFLLLTIGVQAILIELSSPGGWIAGFIGVVCLALATYGLGILPVNWFGLIFLATAFVLFILDIKAPTHGALTVAGAASLLVGALVLFNSPTTPPALRVSPWLAVGVSIFTAATFGFMVSFAIRAQRVPVRTGQESLVGRVGVVREALDPRGTVQLGGELWTAELVDSEPALNRGSRVKVVEIKGLTIKVKKEG